MPTRFLIKKDWHLRSNKFPKNTLFLLLTRSESYTWYQFNSPDKNSGVIKLHNRNLRPLTEDEIATKKHRQKIIQEHIDATSDPFVS